MKKKAIICLIIVIILIVILAIVFINKGAQNNENNSNTENQSQHDNSKVVLTDYDISDIDNIYSNEETKQYKDIRDLGQNYTIENAKQDGCFVIGDMIYNEDVYTNFMEKYQNDENAFIRVVQTNSDGDLIIYDILYDNTSKEITIVTDLTRDRTSEEQDKVIKLRKFEETAEYQYEGHLYWVLYNGDLNDETFNGDEAFIVTAIN